MVFPQNGSSKTLSKLIGKALIEPYSVLKYSPYRHHVFLSKRGVVFCLLVISLPEKEFLNFSFDIFLENKLIE